MAYYSISFSIFLITTVENGTLLVGYLPLSFFLNTIFALEYDSPIYNQL